MEKIIKLSNGFLIDTDIITYDYVINMFKKHYASLTSHANEHFKQDRYIIGKNENGSTTLTMEWEGFKTFKEQQTSTQEIIIRVLNEIIS